MCIRASSEDADEVAAAYNQHHPRDRVGDRRVNAALSARPETILRGAALPSEHGPASVRSHEDSVIAAVDKSRAVSAPGATMHGHLGRVPERSRG